MNKKIARENAIYALKSIKHRYILHKKTKKYLEVFLKKYEDKNKINSILFFLPLSFEVNIISLIKKYKQKTRCFVPFVKEISFKMVPYRYPFHKSRFGTKQSSNSLFYKKQISVAIVPILAIDKKGRRIGFGKGMYDRFFNQKKYKNTFIIFIQLKNIFINDVITQGYDLNCDALITSKRIYVKGKKNDGGLSTYPVCGIF